MRPTRGENGGSDGEGTVDGGLSWGQFREFQEEGARSGGDFLTMFFAPLYGLVGPATFYFVYGYTAILYR